MENLENIPAEYLLISVGLILLFALISNTVLFLKIASLKKRVEGMLGGSSAKTIEESLKIMSKKNTEQEGFNQTIKENINSLEDRVSKSIRGVETIRFNPFKGNGGGGNQSFATSFVDEHGNGVVISSLYSRERMSVYAKPINGFASEHTLSEEEKEALKSSKEKLTDRKKDRS